MMEVYTLDGIPNDLLTSQPEFERSLKVDKALSAISKTVTYNLDGKMDIITETNTKTGEIVVKQLSYLNGKFVGVTII